MQEYNNEKVVALSVKSMKMTSEVLKNAIKNFLQEQENKKPVVYHGKQSIKHLVRGDNGNSITNIEITDQNIKAFNRTARKFNIDYSLKKDNSVSPSRYMVFFKAKDEDVMTAAFKSFLNNERNKNRKPSIKARLKAISEQVKQKTPERTREKTKTREAEL